MKISFKILPIAVLLITAPVLMFAQSVGINDDGSSPNSGAMLDVKSTNKGLLIPRMTQHEIKAIINPANGLHVYCTTDDKLYIFISIDSVWREVAYGAGTIIPGGIGTCGQPFTDARDGKTYNTVMIGSQCWMAQNLNTGLKINGTSNQTNNGIIEKYCYGNLESNCDIYGGLYQWDEAMLYSTTPGVQGICPAGWHFPTFEEWSTLTTFLGGRTVAGGKMKSMFLWSPPNAGATNSSGFTALPGGRRNSDGGTFINLTNVAWFWASSDAPWQAAIYQVLSCSNAQVDGDLINKMGGLSERCVKD